MTLYIKNMVCARCVWVVKQEIEKLGIVPVQVGLGEVHLAEAISDDQKRLIQEALSPFGFDVIDDKKSRMIEKIKNLIIELVHHQKAPMKSNLSDFLADQLNHDYTYISNLFTQVEGTTIEHFYISQKIEKVKELLVYDELTLSEIAFRLHYSSVAHLSSQFKKVTGLTPTHFKQLKERKRNPLDAL